MKSSCLLLLLGLSLSLADALDKTERPIIGRLLSMRSTFILDNGVSFFMIFRSCESEAQ